eukprot:gene17526-20178_t
MERVATTGKTTSVANKLKVGPLKKLYKYMTPEAISVAGGLPMDTCFPFKSIDVNLEGGEHFHLENSKTLLMNYTRGDGIAPLKTWVTEHVKQLHNPREGTESCVTVGSSDAWAKILQLVDTEAIMYDNFAYGTAINIAEVMGKKSIGVPFDEHGMIPEQLRQSVQEARARGITVNLIYMIPVGQNPVGITMPTERKEELYRVCQELDLLIAEDGTQLAVQVVVAVMLTTTSTTTSTMPMSQESKDCPGKWPQTLGRGASIFSPAANHHLHYRSFLSMDTDGRVLRLDSLSKLVAPGMRMGWISGPSQFIEKYMLLQECTSQFPSGLSQSIFTGLTRHHGQDGFNVYAKSIQRHYKSQCKVLMNALTEHFPPGFVQYTRP